MNVVRHCILAGGILAGVSLTALCAAPATAQQLPPRTTDTATDTGEIVVTAQRREQALSDVGLSITAVGGEALRQRNIAGVDDLAKLVPGLSVSDSGYAIPIYTLRGVGINELSIGSTSSVAVYVDEIPLAYPIMTQGAAFDLQRVEVVKGPQGTLYGQNATGGAINYIANKPSDRFEAGVTGTIGRFNRANLEGYVGGPLTPTLKARIAGRASYGGDWQRSITRDAGLGRIENYTGRLIVDWKPTPTVRFSANLNGWIDKSDTVAPQLVEVFPGNSFNVDRNLVVLDANPASCSSPVGLLPNCPINALTGTRITGSGQPVVTRPSLLQGVNTGNARLTDWDPGQAFVRDDKFYQSSLRGEIDLSKELTLISLSSYAHMDRQQNSEQDGTAVSQNLRNFQKGTISSFSQELRLAANFSGVHWILGVNYGNDRTSDRNAQYLRSASAVQNIFGFPSAGGQISADQKIENWAVFTNLDVPLTSRLTVGGGIRLSHDKRSFRGCGMPLDAASGKAYDALLNFFRKSAGLGPFATPILPGSCYSFYTTAAVQARDTAGLPLFTPGYASRVLVETNVPWNVNVNFKPTPDSLLYGRISRGFKAGNFSTLNTTDSVAYNPVKQEQLTAYEVGARARFGRLLRVEGAVFQYDYKDKQLRARVFVGPPFGNINSQDTIPKSRIRGAEFSTVLSPVRGLSIGASGTYLDSKIQRYIGQTVDGVLQDQSGSPFNFTPKWSVNGDVNYTTPINQSLNALVGVNVAYRTRTSSVFTPPNSNRSALAPFEIAAYTLVDGQLGVESADGRWKVFAWGKNMFNKYYWTNVIRVSDVIVRYPGQPATYGLTASFRY